MPRHNPQWPQLPMFFKPAHRVPNADQDFVSTACVVTRHVPERVKLVRPRKKVKALTEHAARYHFMAIRTMNAPKAHAMARVPAKNTMAQAAAEPANVCLEAAPMDFAVVMLVQVPAWLVPSPNAAPATMANADPLPPIPIPIMNALLANAMARELVRLRNS